MKCFFLGMAAAKNFEDQRREVLELTHSIMTEHNNTRFMNKAGYTFNMNKKNSQRMSPVTGIV